MTFEETSFAGRTKTIGLDHLQPKGLCKDAGTVEPSAIAIRVASCS